jgi:hypothetical protein
MSWTACRDVRFPTCVCLALAAALTPGRGRADEDAPPKRADLTAPNVEARLVDDSVLRVRLREERIEVVTRYGKLSVPLADIRRIEFASRAPDDVIKQIDALIEKLNDPQDKTREEAVAELLRFKALAVAPLQKAAKSGNADLAKRAGDALERLRDEVPAEQLEIHALDVIHTDDMRIAGRIEATSLKAQTRAFGEVQIKVAELRLLSADAVPDVDVGNVQPGPVTLAAFGGQHGQKFAFRVTGAGGGGSLWGTDVYTTDSCLAMAAVHAGVLKVGQTGIVRVQIIGQHPGFVGSMRNGIASDHYGAHPGYKILK